MTSDTGDNNYGWDTITFKIREEDKERLAEDTDNLSERLRKIVHAWNDVNEEYAYLDDEFDKMDEVILNTYLNAVRKNISLLKSKEEKLEKELESIRDDENDDVLVEVSIQLDGRTY